LLINALHTDIIISLFRCEIKAGKDIKKNQRGKTAKQLEEADIEGVSSTVKKKMNILTGPTSTQIASNLANLQTTLQNAGQLGILSSSFVLTFFFLL